MNEEIGLHLNYRLNEYVVKPSDFDHIGEKDDFIRVEKAFLVSKSRHVHAVRVCACEGWAEQEILRGR